MPDLIKNNNHIRLRIFVIFFLCSGFCSSFAQSTEADSSQVALQQSPSKKNPPLAPVNNKSPRAAFIRSGIFPGWGQWYNNKKMKALSAFAVETGLAWAVFKQHQLKNESLSGLYTQTYVEQNKTRHSVFQKQFTYLLAGSVLYNMVDAYVDARSENEKQLPRIALYRSLLLPGGGYKYNGSNLKSIFTFGLSAGLLGAAVWNNHQAYVPQDDLLTAPEIDKYRKKYLTNRNNLLLGLSGLILFTAADSYADCLLRDFPENKRSPRVAVIRSASFPGWGQWYNGKKFKALIVLGAEVGFISSAIWYNQRVVETLGDEYSDTSKEQYREFYTNWRNQCVWYLAGTVLFSMADAYVDAHLFDFDESPELTINFDNGFSNQMDDFAIHLKLTKSF